MHTWWAPLVMASLIFCLMSLRSYFYLVVNYFNPPALEYGTWWVAFELYMRFSNTS